MGDFLDVNGELDDRVRLILGGKETKIFQSYSVKTSILQQPAAFSVRLGNGDLAADFIKKYPPRTPFVLMIGDLPQFTGETDGYEAEGTSGETVVVLKGRDTMARLFDGDVAADQEMPDVTYEKMVRNAMEEVGLSDRLLLVSNANSRKAKVGTKITASEPKVSEEVKQTAGAGNGVRNSVRAKFGERWFEFCNRHLESIGLFLWSDFEGNIVLSKPNGNQSPVYKFVRQRDAERNVVNVKSCSFKNDTTRRASDWILYTRARGRKVGRSKIKGEYQDEEMVSLGYERVRVMHDSDISTPASAEALARRKVAESNRVGWQLTYTFSGHTAPTIGGKGRAVIAPDTIAQVEDDELGIHENLYIESVEYRTSPQTETVVTMMRTKDLVW